MGKGWALSFVVMSVMGFGGAVSAQTPDQLRCEASDPDLAISGCTAVIQSGHETQEIRGIAFFARGRAHALKSQFDRAIEDLDQSIRLNPNYADAFNVRGAAYGSKGQYDRAIEDYDQAIRLRSNFADAFYNRGSVYLRRGQLDPRVANAMGYLTSVLLRALEQGPMEELEAVLGLAPNLNLQTPRETQSSNDDTNPTQTC
jgi:tetratricopeptide (TPR) repeat protein